MSVAPLEGLFPVSNRLIRLDLFRAEMDRAPEGHCDVVGELFPPGIVQFVVSINGVWNDHTDNDGRAVIRISGCVHAVVDVDISPDVPEKHYDGMLPI